MTNSSATTFSTTRMLGVLRTAAISDSMITRPARSPCTPTTRRSEWAASREATSLPSRSRSNGTPNSSRSWMRSAACETISSATASSTIPAPAATVSSRCLATVSPGETAAAIPAWAQADDAPVPIGAAVITVTGFGASFSAQNRPAKPPPTIRISSVPPADIGGNRSGWLLML